MIHPFNGWNEWFSKGMNLMKLEYPILEFDPHPQAILVPQVDSIRGRLPDKAVLCFFQDVLQDHLNNGKFEIVGSLKSEIGLNPIYVTSLSNQSITVMHPGVGAALAAGFLERLITAGVEKFIVCGGCGVLSEDLPVGHILIPESAVRDEGTSYHYLPPSRESYPSKEMVKKIIKTLQNMNVPFSKVKTWTTDGVYRETIAKRTRRVQEGCSIVEMEAAALFAVAAFRHVDLAVLCYAGDLVTPAKWDHRAWDKRGDSRALLFEIALQSCLAS